MAGPKRILVTGATRGLGEAIARGLDQLGHHTFLLGRDPEKLEQLKDELSHAQVAAQDLSRSEQLKTLVETVVNRLGGLDGLINSAGVIEPMGLLSELTPTDWEAALRVNLTAPAMLMAAALPHLQKSAGRLVNISSGAAVKPTQGWGAYCAAKAGLLALGQVVAAEQGEVACFSLRPGVIDTEMQRQIRESSTMPEEAQARFLDLHRQGKLESPEIPARAAIWLILEGPHERSGEFIEYSDPQVKAGISQLFSSGPDPEASPTEGRAR